MSTQSLIPSTIRLKWYDILAIIGWIVVSILAGWTLI